EKTTSTSEEVACVALTTISRKQGHYGRCFLQKDMTESMLPYYFQCPVKILDYLDTNVPPPNESAREWRRRCREYHAKRKKGARLADGARIRFKTPLKFT